MKTTFKEFKEDRDRWHEECKVGLGGGFERVMRAHYDMQGFTKEYDTLKYIEESDRTEEESARLEEVLKIISYAQRNIDK